MLKYIRTNQRHPMENVILLLSIYMHVSFFIQGQILCTRNPLSHRFWMTTHNHVKQMGDDRVVAKGDGSGELLACIYCCSPRLNIFIYLSVGLCVHNHKRERLTRKQEQLLRNRSFYLFWREILYPLWPEGYVSSSKDIVRTYFTNTSLYDEKWSLSSVTFWFDFVMYH